MLISKTNRTPIVLAAAQINSLHHIMESEVIETLRLLIDSMVFSDEDGDGWRVLNELSHASDGDMQSKVLLRMIRLLEPELKANIVDRHFASMLDWLFYSARKPEQVQAADLLLNLAGHGIINALRSTTDGYPARHETAPHEAVSCIFREDSTSALIARGADLHRRGFASSYTPFEESPTSLVMYCARAFSCWLHALVKAGVDLASFIDQELELNLAVHAGWEKETLLELFSHGDRPDLHHPDRHDSYKWTCSDCLDEKSGVIIQPYWLHVLERIEGRLHPYDPLSALSDFDEDESDDLGSLEEAVSSSTNLTPELGATEIIPLPNPNEDPAESESESEVDSSEHSTMALSEPSCLYGKHEIVCIDCWLHYTRNGTRKQPAADKHSSKSEDTLSSNDSSECEYSPFLIHS